MRHPEGGAEGMIVQLVESSSVPALGMVIVTCGRGPASLVRSEAQASKEGG